MTTETPAFVSSPTKIYASAIERLIAEYHGYSPQLSVVPYLDTYEIDFLKVCCPDALGLPATFIIDENNDEAFLGVHISAELRDTLESTSDLSHLLESREGLGAFLVLVEEISHFHHYLEMLSSNKQISRFDLELQAELDKIIITAITLTKIFGKPYLVELVHLNFNQSMIHGSMTDYRSVSKIAERFWKDNLHSLGPRLIYDRNFRAHFHKASRLSGLEKKRILGEKIRAA